MQPVRLMLARNRRGESIRLITTALHIVQTTAILYLTVAELAQGLFGDSGTATTAAIQHDAGIAIRSQRRDAAGNLIKRYMDRLPDMGLLVFRSGTHVDDQGLTGGWRAAVFRQRCAAAP